METEISFQSEDGWTIFGSLHVPEEASTEHQVPAVLLLHAAGHDRDAFTSFVYPGLAQLLSAAGIAALRIDWRGRGQSAAHTHKNAASSAEQRDTLSREHPGSKVPAQICSLSRFPGIRLD